jgi:hypothetical protein
MYKNWELYCNLFIIEIQTIIVTATNDIFTVVFTRCVTNRYRVFISLEISTHGV